MKDLYQILGVSRNATDSEIKKAYKALVMKYHPDRNPGDKNAEAKFKEISNAYSVLKDKNKKAEYDRYGTTDGFGGGSTGGVNINDIFSDIFDFGNPFGQKNTRRKHANTAGSDIACKIQISLEDAYYGTESIIEISRNAACKTCNGLGARSASDIIQCTTCHGSGYTTSRGGFFITQQTCHTCNGEGQIIANKCSSCNGKKLTIEKKKIKIQPKKGIDDGTVLKIPNMGHESLSGIAGNMYVEVRIQKHEKFERKYRDLYTSQWIPLTYAIIGGKQKIKTIENKTIEIDIPAGVQNNHAIVVKGHGMRGSLWKGNMYVKLMIEIPVNLNTIQEKLIKDFDNANTKEKNYPKSSNE